MASIQGWHPIALSSSIDAGASAGTRLFGQELVVWRDNSGLAHVWEDRCPHRGMKLSFGFVRGDHIACLYHGWRYDAAGQCRYIPAHPDLDVPRTIKVRIFPAAERAGMIWVGPDEESLSPLAPDGSGETVPVRSLYLDCTAAAAIEAVRSFAPVPFGDADATVHDIRTAGDNLLVLTVGPDTLLIGLQGLSDTSTALHIAISGQAEGYAGAGQLHFLRWTNELRFRIENPPSQAFAPRQHTCAVA